MKKKIMTLFVGIIALGFGYFVLLCVDMIFNRFIVTLF